MDRNSLGPRGPLSNYVTLYVVNFNPSLPSNGSTKSPTSLLCYIPQTPRPSHHMSNTSFMSAIHLTLPNPGKPLLVQSYLVKKNYRENLPMHIQSIPAPTALYVWSFSSKVISALCIRCFHSSLASWDRRAYSLRTAATVIGYVLFCK